jgi:hypothetical protein
LYSKKNLNHKKTYIYGKKYDRSNARRLHWRNSTEKKLSGLDAAGFDENMLTAT